MAAAGKVTGLAEAAALVGDGAVVGIGGNSQSRKPMALIRELVKLGRRDLTVVTFLGGMDVELLLAGGCVRLVRAGYVGFDLVGLAPSHAAAPAALVQVETEASLLLGFQAAASGVGFLPARGSRHTDVLAARPDVRTVVCPYTGEELVAWPALPLDVALIHAPWSDPDGNAAISGAPGVDRLLTEVAATTVVTTESIVDFDTLPTPATVRGVRVDAVVEVPFGAHPTGCHPEYRVDIPHHIEYAGRSREVGPAVAAGERCLPDHASYLDRFVTEDLLRVPA